MNVESTPKQPKYFPMRLTLYCVAHFLIDLASTLIVLGYLFYQNHSYSGCICFYLIAFAGQMPLGLLADKLNRNSLVATTGCILMIGALYLMANCPSSAFTAILLLGALGNALVHVGCGIDVLNQSGKHCGPLGIFVSPGALGLFVGTSLVNAGPDASIYLYLYGFLAVTACALIVAQRLSFGSLRSLNVPLSLRPTLPSPRLLLTGATLALMIVVVIRSYVGLTLSFPWKSQGYWAIFLGLALALGKATGGLLSDRFGMERTAFVTLLLATLFFLAPNTPILGVLAVFLFNMTMPMTLWSLSQFFGNARGFAFGTLTLALILGACITYIHHQPLLPMGWGFSAATLLSLLLLTFGLKPLQDTSSRT